INGISPRQWPTRHCRDNSCEHYFEHYSQDSIVALYICGFDCTLWAEWKSSKKIVAISGQTRLGPGAIVLVLSHRAQAPVQWLIPAAIAQHPSLPPQSLAPLHRSVSAAGDPSADLLSADFDPVKFLLANYQGKSAPDLDREVRSCGPALVPIRPSWPGRARQPSPRSRKQEQSQLQSHCLDTQRLLRDCNRIAGELFQAALNRKDHTDTLRNAIHNREQRFAGADSSLNAADAADASAERSSSSSLTLMIAAVHGSGVRCFSRDGRPYCLQAGIGGIGSGSRSACGDLANLAGLICSEAGSGQLKSTTPALSVGDAGRIWPGCRRKLVGPEAGPKQLLRLTYRLRLRYLSRAKAPIRAEVAGLRGSDDWPVRPEPSAASARRTRVAQNQLPFGVRKISERFYTLLPNACTPANEIEAEPFEFAGAAYPRTDPCQPDVGAFCAGYAKQLGAVARLLPSFLRRLPSRGVALVDSPALQQHAIWQRAADHCSSACRLLAVQLRRPASLSASQ
uniref:WD_REPEATS_REGION domain-containing protein n=1 Tax=Macrostomum lignano TaxID=282301 RepID=A0A1I8FK43_9PLAT